MVHYYGKIENLNKWENGIIVIIMVGPFRKGEKINRTEMKQKQRNTQYTSHFTTKQIILSKGGSGNSHYNGNAETYMAVGEAMGQAMVGLLKE